MEKISRQLSDEDAPMQSLTCFTDKDCILYISNLVFYFNIRMKTTGAGRSDSKLFAEKFQSSGLDKAPSSFTARVAQFR